MPPKQINMPNHQRHHRPRQNPRVQRKKSRQRVMPIFRPADHQPLQTPAHQRQRPQQIDRHLARPETFLVPRQQITRQRNRQHQLQQDEPEPEIDLARRLVSPVNHHLHQMQHQQHRHELRRVMMQTAQKPPAAHLVLDVINALSHALLRTGAVSHPEKHPRDKLHHQRKSQRAAPDITPARPARNALIQRRAQHPAPPRPLIQPVKYSSASVQDSSQR